MAHLREELDAEIVESNRRYVDQVFPFFAAEIDFEWKVSASVAVALGLEDRLIDTIQNGEIKTVSPFVFGQRYGWGDAGTGDIPIHYECQVQHGLGVTGREVALVAALVGFDNMVFYVVRRDDVSLLDVRRKLAEFWHRNVVGDVEPEPQSVADLDVLFPKVKSELSCRATDDVGSKALRLRGIAAHMDALALEAEALEFDVKLAMADRSTLIVDGRKICTWAETNWARIDQEGLKAEVDRALWKKHYKTGRHRVFKTLKSAPKE